MTTTVRTWDLGARTEVTHGALVTISDRLASSQGPPPLVHWSLRQDVADTITVTVDGVTEQHALPALPAAGTVALGAQIYPVNPNSAAHQDITPILPLLPTDVSWLRIGARWEWLQPTTDAWDTTEAAWLDSQLAAADAAGLQVMLTVGTTPDWALPNGATDNLGPPANPAVVAQWVDDIINRWSSTVEIIGIDPWNEPNHEQFWKGTDAQFVAQIQAVHQGAAGRVPTSCGSIAFADTAYMTGLFDLGLTPADFDYLEVHPYPISFNGGFHWVDPRRPPRHDDSGGSLLGLMDLQHAIIEAGGTPKPIWLSEWGVAVNPHGVPGERIDDRRSRDYWEVAIDHAARIPLLEGICAHEAIDGGSGGGSGWNQKWGLLRSDRSRHAKWAAL